jgi:autotransporter-associated beta strand protein
VVINDVSAVPLTVGDYPLVDYTGSIGGTGSAAFALGALPPRTVAHLDFSNPGVIDCDLTSIDYPVWTGSASSVWSTATIASPKNCVLATAGSGTDFLTGDNVVFNDLASTGNVQISAANVKPASATFDNTATTYTLTGPYGIADYSTSRSTAVNLNGSGLVVFATSNSYTGGTYINGGTLQIGNGTVNGSIAGAVNDNSVLAFNPAGTASFANVVGGSGGVEMGGSGRMILTAVNEYSGATTIDGGTLQLGSGVTAGSISGSVTDNGTLSFNEPVATTFASVVNGAGTLTQDGTNVLSLTASNGYTGTTYVNAGTLSVGGGRTGESLASPAIVDNAALAFNHTDTMTYAGNISGGGSVNKLGSGTTVLTGSNT